MYDNSNNNRDNLASLREDFPSSRQIPSTIPDNHLSSLKQATSTLTVRRRTRWKIVVDEDAPIFSVDPVNSSCILFSSRMRRSRKTFVSITKIWIVLDESRSLVKRDRRSPRVIVVCLASIIAISPKGSALKNFQRVPTIPLVGHNKVKRNECQGYRYYRGFVDFD